MDPFAVWEGTGVGAQLARAALSPLAWLFEAGVAGRNALFDAGVLARRATAIPAISVGNLSVGGTGKTPVAADVARRLRDAGAHPAIVLRGYGDDEPAVHAILNPDVPVLTSPDRVAGCEAAHARGCDVAVLDDAFQHRQAARAVDIVLVAAEQWRQPPRFLPAGPYREGASALRRASLVIVTRKTASAAEAHDLAARLAASASIPSASVAFHLDSLRRVGGGDDETMPLSSLGGQTVLAVTGIGAPRAFVAQLEGVGARVDLVSFPDHHRFSDADVARIGARISARNSARAPRYACVVCTLKDGVKLGNHWPRAGVPLWYVSQRLTVESGEAAYVAAIRRVLDARP
ncbi:MAG: tetraacyldisaccharide 4'-kinase [Gemmatimonadaceae bacterium]|nr:tetraacyldisaccharide 4'-kinase [Gemmatimonadaceae bacterium]